MWPLPFSAFILSSFVPRWVYFRACRNYKNSRFGLIPVKRGCNVWCYSLKNTNTIPGGQNYLKKFLRFCPPTCKKKHLDCCARRNLNLGGGARERSDEASRLCCLVPVRRFPSPSRSIVSMTYPRRKGGGRLTFSHGPRDRKRFGHEKKWGLGTRQETLLSIFYAAPHWNAHPAN